MRTNQYPETLEKWRDWIDVVRKQSHTLAFDDMVFRNVMRKAEESRVSTTTLISDWMMRNYWHSALMAIRRLLDTDSKTYSLVILLKKIERNPQIISRESYIDLYPSMMREDGIAEETFDDIVGKSSSHVDPKTASADIDRLCVIHDKLKPIVDQGLAHFDRSVREPAMFTGQFIHDAISTIEDVAQWWETILCGSAAPVFDDSNHLHSIEDDLWVIWMPGALLPSPPLGG